MHSAEFNLYLRKIYKEGEGYPKFDQAKANEYFAKVNQKVAKLIIDTKAKWDLAGL